MILLIRVISFNYYNKNKMKQYTQTEDAVSEYGFSIEPILLNDKFSPSIFVEIGNYLIIRVKYYSVLAENTISYHVRNYSYLNLYMASNQIISINQQKYNVDPIWAFKKYLTNN